MPVIGCSYINCQGWVHKPCSGLSHNAFVNQKFYYCSNACEKKANPPEKSVQTKDDVENLRKLVEQSRNRRDKFENTSKTQFTKVQNHLVDVKCSHISPNDLDPSFLKRKKSELTYFKRILEVLMQTLIVLRMYLLTVTIYLILFVLLKPGCMMNQNYNNRWV